MKTIGLLGGMSWESTLHYYAGINRRVKEKLGGLHSAEILLYSVDFAPIAEMQAEGRWSEAAQVLAQAATRLESAGADFLVLCTNTMHLVAPEIAAAVAIPLLHIADATAAEVKRQGVRRVGLLGTAFTMEHAFYRQRLEQEHALEVLTPSKLDRALIHRVIYQELCQGEVVESSRREFRRIASELANAGADGVILGCTEIMMLLSQSDLGVPVFDTTALHAAAAADLALSGRDAGGRQGPGGPNPPGR
jgi:aspartate racemase